jgi:diguanylate cyclase (GGDEF)-like protein
VKTLIVEDDPVQRQLLGTLLRHAGYEVIEAANGQDAWDLLQNEHFRLVLTDWVMPKLDGLGLIQRIREANWSLYTYIILLTSKEYNNSIVAGLNIGADDCLNKPYERDELIAHLGIGRRILDLESRLVNMARHDLLTGLFNRLAFYETTQAELGRAMREGTPTSLIMVDLDHFKMVNDRFGYLIGDQALCLVARILQQNRRVYDCVGRWGGEEFMVLLPNTDLNGAMTVAERMRVNIGTALLNLPQVTAIELNASLGVCAVAAATDSPTPVEMLLQQADRALYQAKCLGGNQVCVYSDVVVNGL